jgi:hypothetical protein
MAELAGFVQPGQCRTLVHGIDQSEAVLGFETLRLDDPYGGDRADQSREALAFRGARRKRRRHGTEIVVLVDTPPDRIAALGDMLVANGQSSPGGQC